MSFTGERGGKMSALNKHKLAARMALEAYNDNPKIPGHGVTTFSVGNTQGFMAVKGLDLWIAFAGTNEPRDWITNLDAAKIDGYADGSKIHKGFNNALSSVWTAIMPVLCSREWDNIYIVGHSLGGALASLLASRLLGNKHTNKIINLITFGAPRCGDATWALVMDTVFPPGVCSTRFVRAGDIVPHVPSVTRWRHAGQEIFFDESGKVVPNSWHRQLVGAARILLTRRESWTNSAVLDAHNMYNYFLNVEMLK